MKRINLQEITLNHIRNDLEDDHKFFTFLEQDVTGRSLPSRQMQHGVIDPEVVAVLFHTLQDGSVEFNCNNSAMVRCFRLGFVHTEEIRPGQMIFVLPSVLHAR